MTIQRALVSVSDKTGLVEFGRHLRALGIEILSTGGSAQTLLAAGIDVTEVSTHTGFPEIMAGRVKTLHPKIHGGILARRDIDQAVMAEHDIAPIDLVVVNLYPFAQTIARPDCTDELAIENIDIGGPAMVRAAAKNHRDVLVVVDPEDYSQVIRCLEEGDVDQQQRRLFALKAFQHTADYDSMVADYLAGEDEFPPRLRVSMRKAQDLRYGENAHQKAALYVEDGQRSGTLANVKQWQGKALSYNNIADTDAALQCVLGFTTPACVIVKHANPCGVAAAEDLRTAYQRAFLGDKTSAFGGIVAFNRQLDAATLDTVLSQQFAEVVIAPAVSEDAVELAQAKKNLRLLSCGEKPEHANALDYKRIEGGLLVQTPDTLSVDEDTLRVVTDRSPSESEMADLMFAWRVAWFVKSNAIVYARDGQTLGIGAGQMSRVVSAKIAALKAAEENLSLDGAALASDAFFPFRDGIDAAAAAGIKTVIQPGGSMRDEEVIAAANEHGMAMVFTGVRHFRH